MGSLPQWKREVRAAGFPIGNQDQRTAVYSFAGVKLEKAKTLSSFFNGLILITRGKNLK